MFALAANMQCVMHYSLPCMARWIDSEDRLLAVWGEGGGVELEGGWILHVKVVFMVNVEGTVRDECVI